MDKLLEIIFKQNLPWYIVLIIFFIFFITYKILNNFQYFHNFWMIKDRNKINDLLKKKKVVSSSELRNLVQDTIDEYVFKRCTGIQASKHLRKVILKLHLEHQIELFHFKRAIKFITINKGNIEIKISKLDKFEKYINIIFSIFLFIFSIYETCKLYEFKDKLNLIQMALLFLIIFTSSMFGTFVLTQNFPLKSAILLKKKLCDKKTKPHSSPPKNLPTKILTPTQWHYWE